MNQGSTQSEHPGLMCPEGLAGNLEALLSPYAGDCREQDRFGFDRERSAGLYRSYADALPSLALGFRMYADPTIRDWVAELSELEEPAQLARAGEMARGASRGTGRRLIVELLTQAAEEGPMMLYGAFAAFVVPDSEPPRARKAGAEHDRYRALSVDADRIVRALVAYPAGIEPADNPEAARRSENRLLAGAARHRGA